MFRESITQVMVCFRHSHTPFDEIEFVFYDSVAMSREPQVCLIC